MRDKPSNRIATKNPSFSSTKTNMTLRDRPEEKGQIIIRCFRKIYHLPR